MPLIGRLVLAYALSASLAACVSTPGSLPPFAPLDPPGGVPLSSSDTLAFFISSERTQRSEGAPATVSVHSITNTGAVAQAFRTGFLGVRADVQLVEADADLRAACFDSSERFVEPGGVVLAIPSLKDVRCRGLVEARRIRYLLTIGGQRETATFNEFEFGVASAVQRDDFRLVARAIDTGSGVSMCEQSYSQSARTAAAVVFVFFFVPIPMMSLLDASGYWKDAGIFVGQRTAWCFVEPRRQD